MTSHPQRVHLIAAYAPDLIEDDAGLYFGVAELVAAIAPDARPLRAQMRPGTLFARRLELMAAVAGVLELEQKPVVAAAAVFGDVDFLEALADADADALSFVVLDTVVV